MAEFELLTGATGASVVAAGNGHLVNWSSRIADGVSRRGAAGKPVCMNVAGGWRYQFNEPLMSRVGILVSLDRFLQPVPPAFGAVEMDVRWMTSNQSGCSSINGFQPEGSSAMPLT